MPNLKYLTIILLLLLVACSTRQPVPIGEIPLQGDLQQAEIEAGAGVFNQLQQQYTVSDDIKMNDRIRKIVTKLSDAVGGQKYSGNPWHTYVLEDDNLKNAGATKGNYIFIWTGLINSAKNDAELSTVLAHEISHVLAKHTSPTASELTNNAVGNIAGQIAAQVTAQTVSPALASLAGNLTSMLYQGLLVNPESRRLESEADTIGLFLMAKAGYHPQAALDFWHKAAMDPSFASSDIKFISSHPPSAERLENLKDLYPEALELYRRNKKRF